MSQVRRRSSAFSVACALVALLAVGCSKKNGVAFDPDAGHPDDFFPTHPAAYRDAGGECSACHGSNLLGGIAAVSCYSTSRDGQACHPDGPGGHPAGWRALHSADPSAAATCAPCHDNPSNNLAPNCFDNSLCHGPKAGHPPGWRTAHSGTNPSQASACASCHDNPSNSLPPNCFNNSLCHGAKSSHPAGWRQTHTGTNPAQAPSCASCHDNPSNSLPPNCFNNSLCHGAKSSHPAGWRQTHTRTNPAQAPSCASCHDNPSNSLPPNCFNNSLCHGAKSSHPAGWRQTHTGTDPGQASVCAGCHQSNPGTPGCFNNTLCHGSQGGHPAGWSAGSQHGATAKAAPSGSSGFLSCESCHGSGLNGGSANQSCLINTGCHGWSAPHASSGWAGGGGSHRTTNQGNALVCGQCHRSSPGTAGCFNSTLCHGD